MLKEKTKKRSSLATFLCLRPMLVPLKMVTHRGLVRPCNGGKRSEAKRYVISLSISDTDKATQCSRRKQKKRSSMLRFFVCDQCLCR